MLGQIGQIAIQVHDLVKMEAFYRDKLKLKFLFNVPGRMSFFDMNGIRLLMGVPEPGEAIRGNSIIYFKVTDIDKAFTELTSRGVDIGQKPELVAPMPDHDLWIGFVNDPEGNIVALMEERKR